MAQVYELHATRRAEADMGKAASRRLRNTDHIPAVIYGAGKEPAPLTINHNELTKALKNEGFYSHILTIHVDGKPEKAILKALHRHVYKPKILHVDLLRVDESHKLTMNVPLHFLGEEEAPGVKVGKGTFIHNLFDVEVTCFPADLPEAIDVDVSGLNVGESVHLSQLKFPKGVQSTQLAQGSDHDMVVVHIEEPRVVSDEEEDTSAPEAPAAPDAETGEA